MTSKRWVCCHEASGPCVCVSVKPFGPTSLCSARQRIGSGPSQRLNSEMEQSSRGSILVHLHDDGGRIQEFKGIGVTVKRGNSGQICIHSKIEIKNRHLSSNLPFWWTTPSYFRMADQVKTVRPCFEHSLSVPYSLGLAGAVRPSLHGHQRLLPSKHN